MVLYLQANIMKKSQLFKYANAIQKLSRRELLLIVLDTPAHQTSELTLHMMAGSLHPRRASMQIQHK